MKKSDHNKTKRAVSPAERNCLFVGSNCMARAALRAPTRTKIADAIADLDDARTQADDLLRCLRHHMRRKKK